MTRRKPLTISGQRIAPGETRELRLKFSETYLGGAVEVPVHVIRARRPGPRLFIIGGVHGDEIMGLGILRELLYENPPALLRGTLVCAPVVNIFGLEHQSRYLPDRRDLNRCFPGFEQGSLTSRLAFVVFNEIIRQCDFGIDLHSATGRRSNYPNIRADMRNPLVKQLARAFGCEIIISGKGPEGSLRRTAIRHGVPTIVLEAGEVWKIEPGVVKAGIRGCLNVLRHLGMLKGEPERPLFQITLSKTTWVRAERGGFLTFHASSGDLVREGQELATNYCVFGHERNQLISPVDGVVLGMTTMPAVKPGEPVYHIAALKKKTYASIHQKIQRGPDQSLFLRTQEDLSRKIVVEGADSA